MVLAAKLLVSSRLTLLVTCEKGLMDWYLETRVSSEERTESLLSAPIGCP